MRSHFLFMVSFAFLAAAVIALVTKSNPWDQWIYFLKFFFSLIVIALIIAWIMYPFPLR